MTAFWGKVQLINVNSEMKKFWFIFLAKKGCTNPLVKISFFKKILVRWISSILCSHVAFSSIVLFDMFLWSNDFKRFVISKYGKYYVAYFVWDSSHCYKLCFWFTFLQIVIAEYGIFSLSGTRYTDALQGQCVNNTSCNRGTSLVLCQDLVQVKMRLSSS